MFPQLCPKCVCDHLCGGTPSLCKLDVEFIFCRLSVQSCSHLNQHDRQVGFRLSKICIHALSHCHRQWVGPHLFSYIRHLADCLPASGRHCWFLKRDALSIGIVICCLQALAEALKHNKTLPTLDLRFYGFGDAEVQAVFRKIEFWNVSCFKICC